MSSEPMAASILRAAPAAERCGRRGVVRFCRRCVGEGEEGGAELDVGGAKGVSGRGASGAWTATSAGLTGWALDLPLRPASESMTEEEEEAVPAFGVRARRRGLGASPLPDAPGCTSTSAARFGVRAAAAAGVDLVSAEHLGGFLTGELRVRIGASSSSSLLLLLLESLASSLSALLLLPPPSEWLSQADLAAVRAESVGRARRPYVARAAWRAMPCKCDRRCGCERQGGRQESARVGPTETRRASKQTPPTRACCPQPQLALISLSPSQTT